MSDKKRWAELSMAEIKKIKQTNCNKCFYSRKTSSPSQNCGNVFCDYISIEGHSRGCRPDECDKFKPRSKHKKYTYTSLD